FLSNLKIRGDFGDDSNRGPAAQIAGWTQEEDQQQDQTPAADTLVSLGAVGLVNAVTSEARC
ncbi:hypothetical protein L916_01097, partial [Phytophthora nicotianae]